jgi:hypothetical protein
MKTYLNKKAITSIIETTDKSYRYWKQRLVMTVFHNLRSFGENYLTLSDAWHLVNGCINPVSINIEQVDLTGYYGRKCGGYTGD